MAFLFSQLTSWFPEAKERHSSSHKSNGSNASTLGAFKSTRLDCRICPDPCALMSPNLNGWQVQVQDMQDMWWSNTDCPIEKIFGIAISTRNVWKISQTTNRSALALQLDLRFGQDRMSKSHIWLPPKKQLNNSFEDSALRDLLSLGHWVPS